MSPDQAGLILSWFSGQHAEVERIEFWPRFRVDEKSANEYTIEPDVVVDGRVGWKLYRIWSTDWFNNPRQEAEKLCATIADQLAALKLRVKEFGKAL